MAGSACRCHAQNSVSSGLLVGLNDQGLVDVWDDTTASDRGLDQSVEFFVTANSQLQVARGDSLHLKVLACVASQLENLSCEVLEDGGRVDGGRGADTTVGAHSTLEEPVDSAHGELFEKHNVVRDFKKTIIARPTL